jgi:hypothetical protein
MITDLKTYPEYKESGLPWLGQEPEHRGIKQLKTVVRVNPSTSEPGRFVRSSKRLKWIAVRPGSFQIKRIRFNPVNH